MRLLLVAAFALAGCRAPAEAAGPRGIPFGFWGLNGKVDPVGLKDVQTRLGATVFHTATRGPRYATEQLLPMAKASGMQVSLRLTGGHEFYTAPNGDFSLEMWSGMLERWRDAGLEPFIADGTLVTHMLIDDMYLFEGRPPTAEDLEAMARLSHEILPGLRTFVRARATELPVPAGGRYRHVDFCVNQYHHKRGDVNVFVGENMKQAKALDLGVINGLNIADSGDGSSGQPGWRKGHWALSAGEITRYGRPLVRAPEAAMFLAWEYDAEEKWSDGSVGAAYFDQPDKLAALQGLARVARERAAMPLRPATGAEGR